VLPTRPGVPNRTRQSQDASDSSPALSSNAMPGSPAVSPATPHRCPHRRTWRDGRAR
jgi:hypothetical protein